MTAAFGTLTNNTDEEVTLVAASTDACSDGRAARGRDEGRLDGDAAQGRWHPDPGGGSATLEPGGDHIMLMDVTAPIEPGDVVELELELSDGSRSP